MLDTYQLYLSIIPALIGAAASIGGGLLSGMMGNKAAKSQQKAQVQFAKNAIQWKTQDALKAGIHPLYALGAQTTSYQPVSVGGTSDLGSGIADAGKQIAQGMSTPDAPGGRPNALALELAKVQIDGAKIDNQIKMADLSSKVANSNPAGSSIPAWNGRFLVDGQGNSHPAMDPSLLRYGGRQRDPAEPGSPHVAAGAYPDLALTKTNTGGYAPVMPPDLAESLESDPMGQAIWMLRNRIIPSLSFGQYGQAPNIPRQPYEDVYYNPFLQEYRRKQRPITNFRNRGR